MAFALPSTVPTSLYTHFRLTSQVFITPVKSIRGQVPHTVQCNIGVSPKTSDEKIVRRSANYQPPIWDFDYVQSLNSKYVGDKYVTRAAKLKEDVKKMLTEVADPLDGLEIIDDLQRLGVFYHFEEEIKRVLESIYNCKRDGNEEGLHATSLKFRLLRQHGYDVPQGTSNGVLKLFTKWWNRSCLGTKLSFARDRLVENFLWPIGQNFKPQFSNFRRNMTVVNALITVVDDVYDVYGTLDELEIFTNAIERWDISAMEQLPDYMKICFLAVFNSINEMGYETLTEQDVHIIPHLQKSWTDMCKAYLKEAKWYYSGYKPTLEEYMSNAWISIAAPTMLTHAYFLCTNPINMEGLDWLVEYPNIIRWSAIILRLADDLGTSPDEMKRGDIPKSIQCYMHETGASEEDARDHIKYLIGKTWEKMNEDRFADSPFSQTLVEIAMNLARVSQCMYLYGDGHAAQESALRIPKSLLIHNVVDPTSMWDISAMEQLPNYMKICFLALFNSINEIGYEIVKEQDANIIPYLRKVWADLCKTYLNEAKWYYSGYTPTLEEYMSNAWISIGAPTMLTHGYFLCTNPINTDGLDWLVKYPNIMRWSATVLRVADDLGTSSDEMERGDNPKSIQCYMHETGASEEDARDHIKYMIGKTWEKMNEERLADPPFSKILVEIAMNIARVSQCMYQYGDGHSTQGQETKDRVLALFINPVPLEY
ncbi:hypothetical protein RHSIM_Rhsim03G0006700 [Rhododendron simsii]|uniref:Uncharacterized protein n=1 Tax=Rhododendron simsii TaxID=118357 RepID=A0A834HA89_RHOSS|nr:hypothetical protein RHSIM_Rhsim03G0006700 [Rhododendron simsii]